MLSSSKKSFRLPMIPLEIFYQNIIPMLVGKLEKNRISICLFFLRKQRRLFRSDFNSSRVFSSRKLRDYSLSGYKYGKKFTCCSRKQRLNRIISNGIYFRIGQAKYKDSVAIDFMTSHHESGTEDIASKQRIEQLKLCFQHMLNAPADRFVLFGGDLNVREKEVEEKH